MLLASASTYSALLLSSRLTNAGPATPAEASNALQLTLNKGFWSGKVKAGASDLNLVVDTGSYALLINQNQYKPSGSATPTSKGAYIQFSGGNENGTENIDVNIAYVEDTVSILDYEVSKFLVGNITDQSALLPSNGVLGLSQQQSYSNPSDPNDSNGQSFVQTLCDENLISECGFGLLLETNDKGTLIFGEMDPNKYQGDLITVKTTEYDFWTVDPSSTANSQVVVNSNSISPINISFDNGSPNIFAPYDQGLKVLQAAKLNITTMDMTDGNGKIAFGTYPCKETPPKIGFNFNNQSLEDSLYVDSKANILERSIVNGEEVCRINLLATTAMDEAGGWLVGQTWFQGRYVQHDIQKHRLTFAYLRRK